MKQKDIGKLVLVAVIAAVLALIISGVIFKANTKNEQVPFVESIDPSFPDVRNESGYKAIFNDQALDPTQPVQIQGNNNSRPF